MLDIYGRLMEAGISMREIECMDIRRYFDILFRELERREEKQSFNNNGSGNGQKPFYLQRGTIDQIFG